ncbi:hypothetical protein PF005_g12537 [Phytophthora fragariae]|uniref:Retrovirus-related Pol polyprotein from transposon TNT 1-94-like beta-barrel domain-containing protein n=1 Tax=Phytophthora fragariae TaxID=53985 RepID=A0A6A3ERT2_9STRA|nr:hypothetical protein PF003_g10841 [Phytophthora fragariae]KAE8936232.1 hypothetical protein PF009_g13832 [Phytophthora fragariae]KAE9000355.1 hypothetical protein PF011_g14217 [Phytophthora fragariae]KAE9094637.1 hypothetical protein PF007_g17694 [Phytophthora fragariae]KAE9094878.1 hypothetical protein PF010_g16924 [Phytophthora fragariae]
MPETKETKNERALVAAAPTPPSSVHSTGTVCSYCDRPRHHIRQCRGLQNDLRDGRVKTSTVLPANFAFKGGNTNRDHPYRNDNKSWNRGCNSNDRNNSNRSDKRNKGSDGSKHGNRGNHCDQDRAKNRSLDSDSDDEDNDTGRNRKVFRQKRRDAGLIAVATTVCHPVGLTAQANVRLDPTWTIDSGCTRHVTHEPQWFSDITASGGSITVGGKNQIPIEGIGRVDLEVMDSKGNPTTLCVCESSVDPEVGNRLDREGNSSSLNTTSRL